MTTNTTVIEFAVLSFGSLMTMINPFGILPTFMSLTNGLTVNDSRRIAIRASLTALIILFTFAIGGKLLFHFLGLSVESLRIVGGFIFFLAGYEMFKNKLPKMKRDAVRYEEDIANAYENAITPIGIPLISGPGSITTVMLLMQESGTVGNKFILFGSIVVVIGITLTALLSAQKIMTFLGRTGRKVLMRITGLIVMVIAVDFFIGGVKPVLEEIFCK